MLKSTWDHPITFWALLSLPTIPMTLGLTSGTPDAVKTLLHPTGEFAARFMIIAMMITPLMMLFRDASWPRWLMKRRRYLGVAAFFYALAHTVLYLIDEGAIAFTGGEVSKLYIWTGWIAFLIFVPLAVTSTDAWVRRLGRSWKKLQQFVYAAAILTLIHWAALHDWGGVGAALVHFAPLVALEVYRLWSTQQRRRHRALT
ncbi:sulfoxide reductase heme-binding subunit YedZ [Sulfitobacter pontiacus]|uniref:Sulfoxide reductase heme-binding subunit YedZ n=1 Tax=Sulfitobacter pontiacus TaxID=60137 RepID=A0A1H2XTC6_9RHOB|nr:MULTISPECIES: ferric reductase-like transmembrane domain-containing protein [Sulfitobacter]QPO09537.1 ferric reductase-like transmembrane domain-containing protein [Sulfitobacter sp. B30-2]SDW96133.1 sulfoxide reductase heme-binding subunit YedZ [Sulfitobacter pontiacus]